MHEVKIGDIFRWKESKEILLVNSEWGQKEHRYFCFNADRSPYLGCSGGYTNIAGDVINNDEIERIGEDEINSKDDELTKLRTKIIEVGY